MRLGAAFFLFLTACLATTAHGQTSKVQIIEKTKFYTIKGKSAAEFAVSMSKKGPYSRQHRRRAWATAARVMKHRLIHQKIRGVCHVKGAEVKLNITYTMPKLRSVRGISKRELRKWRKMYALLDKHERTHGLYYRQLARQVHRALRKIKPAKSCRTLVKNSNALVKTLSEKNRAKNQRFDDGDGRNYRRMERLYSGS